MTTRFEHTLPYFRTGRVGIYVTLGGAMMFAAAFAAWLVLTRMNVYAVSDDARVEVTRPALRVQTPAGGAVLESSLALGRVVQRGEPLVVLDARQQRIALHEATSRRDALGAQAEALRAELDAEGRSAQAVAGGSRAAARAAGAKIPVLEPTADFARSENEATQKLHARGAVADAVADRAEMQARRDAAEVRAAKLEAVHVAASHKTDFQQSLVRIARLSRELVTLDGERAALVVTIERLELEVEERTIRAPADGTLGDIATIAPGTVVAVGDYVAAIVPTQELRVVAYFAPDVALRKIRPGDRAVLRVHGFPWAQYGTLSMTATQVATEASGGKLRAEFALGAPNSALPAAHGMTGSLEVCTETITPARFVLRWAGKLLAGPSPPLRVEPATAEPGPAADVTWPR